MSETGRGSKSVGLSFVDWAARIYPAHLVVTNSTQSLRVLRLKMLAVVERIDHELKRRERA